MTQEHIKWPFGKAEVLAPAFAAALNITVRNNLTFVNVVGAMSAGMTLNVTNEGVIEQGARIVLKALSDGTARTVTPGTGCSGVAEAGVISKTKVIEFEYQGTSWVLVNARQID